MKFNRKLIDKKENKVSILQIIGFIMMGVGIGYLLANLFWLKITPSDMALNFFIIMLGFAFAFPSLLKGNQGLSTMRIVVFMITNVICILLLKIGWNDSITSLKDIGLDQYWMGVIAFVFGAKATQSFFESKMAVPFKTINEGMASVDFDNAEIAKLAVSQNETYLRTKFKNIVSISDAVNDLNQSASHVVALYLKDNNALGIPDKLQIRMPDHSIKTIPTEIIKGVGVGKIHFGQLDSVQDVNLTKGSICCVVNTPSVPYALVTAGHVYSDDASTSANGSITNGTSASISGVNIGNWIFQIINDNTDAALVGIKNYGPDPNYLSFNSKTHYTVTDNDVNKTKVTLMSNVRKTRIGYILDYNTAWPVDYSDTEVQKSNIIVIGSTNDRTNSITLSEEGDSGGCVYEPVSGNLVGIILGGNDMYTWVLSLQDLFTKQNFKLL